MTSDRIVTQSSTKIIYLLENFSEDFLKWIMSKEKKRAEKSKILKSEGKYEEFLSIFSFG